MNFIYDGIGDWFSDACAKSNKVFIATAFINMNTKMENDLKSIDNVDIVISDNWIINNPYSIENLIKNKNINVTQVSFDDRGKFHPKVYLFYLKNNKYSLMIGSANFTYSGMHSNDEAMIAIDEVDDSNIILNQVFVWMNYIKEKSKHINLLEVKHIYDNRIKPIEINIDKEVNYWVIKPGYEDYNCWDYFKKENVISIGWDLIDLQNVKYKNDFFDTIVYNQIIKEYPDKSDKSRQHVLSMFKMFYLEMKPDDLVIISGGYASNNTKPIPIYGFAKIKSTAKYDKTTSWWPSKIKVSLDILEETIEMKDYMNLILNESMRQTIHRINDLQFRNVYNLYR